MDKKILKEGLLECGYELPREKEERFFKYSEMIVEWNQKMNLTSITDPVGISVKHFLDSTVPVFKINIPQNSKIIDIGTGAGFPGVPIKILRDDLSFTYLDSLNKRINFLKAVSEEIGFENVEFIHGRAEEAGQDKNLRGTFDYAVSRAVAPLKILSEYAVPLLKKGGKFLAFKAFEIEDEVNDAKSMIGNLGAKIEENC